jgi:hypothetical protein
LLRAGEFSAADKQRFYRMAARSATESAAVLDIINQRHHAPSELLAPTRQLLERVVSMLIRMCRPNRSGTGTGTPASRAGTGAGH